MTLGYVLSSEEETHEIDPEKSPVKQKKKKKKEKVEKPKKQNWDLDYEEQQKIRNQLNQEEKYYGKSFF